MKKFLLFIGIFLVLTILILTGYSIYWKKSRSGEIAVFSESPNLEVGRMKVSILPEYDEPKVLVIYEGRFKNQTLFPSKARFIIPKGADISDACSRSPQGGHF